MRCPGQVHLGHRSVEIVCQNLDSRVVDKAAQGRKTSRKSNKENDKSLLAEAEDPIHFWGARFLNLNEVAGNGPYLEMEAAFELFITRTIKLALEPLQSDGQSQKPSIIHGAMWGENAAINLATNEPVVFDCMTMYAHNEFEIRM